MHEKIFGSMLYNERDMRKIREKREYTSLENRTRINLFKDKYSTPSMSLLLLFLYFQYLCDPLNKMLISRYFIINYQLLWPTWFLNK